MIAMAMLFGAVCSVDDAGLNRPPDAGASGSGGLKGSGGAAGQAGTHGTGGGAGSGGSSTGGFTGTGGVNTGTGGRGTGGGSGASGAGGRATGGGTGTGGTTGTGGVAGAGGSAGTGGAAGAGGTAGTPGTGGVAGAGGKAGAGGAAGTGGVAGAGGMSGSGGRGGTGGTRPSCKGYPSGASMTLPEDFLLHCYWAHGNQIDWNSAEAVCENEGGTLVTISSSDENMLVLHLATQANLFSGAGAVPTVFIGALDKKASNDDSGPGDYVWITGEAFPYENWHNPNYPSGACTGCNGGGTCACAHWAAMAADGTWYDRQEAPPRPFLCEAVAQ
jgi:hypothetical protein